ncbi:MAG TPA: hypothetical protein H9740_00585 [Candidatus Hungatella pullicola]|nr:hypothetical protein [Candidatus Hungatella pullicola]
MVGFILFVVIVVVIVACVAGMFSSSNNHSYTAQYNEPSNYRVPNDSQSSSSKPKISAELSSSFYQEVRNYCDKNSLSASELIRRAVKEYMNTH